MRVEFRSKRTEEFFSIQKLKLGRYTIDEIVREFNINNYVIIKATRNFRVLNTEEFYNLNYSCYTFIRKDLFDLRNFNLWNNFLEDNRVDLVFYKDCLFPEFNPNDKIKFIKYEDL
jgi:hypothetical protein